MDPRYADFAELGDELPQPPPPWRERMLLALRRPIALALFGVVVIGMLALFYLNEVAGTASANAQLSALRDQQARLDRQESLLREELGEVTSPAYIDQRARALGLIPGSAAPTFIIREPKP